jgi:hypothetical protein
MTRITPFRPSAPYPLPAIDLSVGEAVREGRQATGENYETTRGRDRMA